MEKANNHVLIIAYPKDMSSEEVQKSIQMALEQTNINDVMSDSRAVDVDYLTDMKLHVSNRDVIYHNIIMSQSMPASFQTIHEIITANAIKECMQQNEMLPRHHYHDGNSDYIAWEVWKRHFIQLYWSNVMDWGFFDKLYTDLTGLKQLKKWNLDRVPGLITNLNRL